MMRRQEDVIRYYFEWDNWHRAIGVTLELTDQLSGSVFFNGDLAYSRRTS